MRRRSFLAGLFGAVAVPLAAEAQQPTRVPRIAIMYPAQSAANAHVSEAFKQGLRENGYVEGQNAIVEIWSAEGRAERLPGLAAELVRLKVDVIVAATDLAVGAARHQAQTIPIVMVLSADPVGTGFVASLARPGGNVTGLTIITPELSGKRVELLREIVPNISRLAFLWNPEVAGAPREYKEIEAAARQFKLQIQSVEVRRREDVDGALSALMRGHPNALLLAALNPVIFGSRAQVTNFAAQQRLPTMYPIREYVDAGGLVAYGPNIPDMFHRAAGYVNKILKGAKPADLPVEQPTKLELVINLKTAKALGLTIPPSLLLRADHVIE